MHTPLKPRSTLGSKKFAAIDLGSNTCRLLIAESKPEKRLEVIDSYSRIIRLGEGLTAKKMLSSEAIERALETLKICAHKLEKHKPLKIRCIATEACRKSENSSLFLQKVKKRFGLKFEIIAIEEEARLSMLACTPLLSTNKPFAIIFDIGGGSTEILWIRLSPNAPPKMEHVVSIPFGVVTMSETYGTYCPAVFDNIAAAVCNKILEQTAPEGFKEALAQGTVQLVGCSGTATTIAALSQGLEDYDKSKIDNAALTPDDIERVHTLLNSLSPTERVVHPCIGSGRSDLVIPGLAIFTGIHKAFPINPLHVADRGVRDGILEEFAAQNDLQLINA